VTPQPSTWLTELRFRERLRETLLARPAQAADARDLANVDFYRVVLMSASPHDAAQMGHAIREAAAASAAAVLCRQMPEGSVSLGGRSIPVDTVPLTPVFWMRGVACALIARDAEALEIFCCPPHIQTVQLPLSQADAFWPFLCAALTALIGRRSDTEAFLREAELLLAPAHVAIATPTMIRCQIKPLLELIRSLSQGGNDFESVLHAALEAHREWAISDKSDDPFHLLPLEVLGLAALASDRGLEFDAGGLPVELVRGSLPGTPVPVVYELPMCRAEQPNDPTQLLDLKGFPRSGRKHTLVTEGDALIARYNLSGRPGVPRARAAFILQGGDRFAPPALDARERVMLADFYSAQVTFPVEPNDMPRAQELLRQAIASLDLALAATIPPEEQPDRFRRERLTIYRDALQEQLNRLLPPDIDLKLASFAMAGIIREKLRPLLAELARDRTGAVCQLLRPREDDFEKVFQPAIVSAVRQRYQTMWSGKMELPLAPGGYTELDIHIAPAGMLASDNELSRPFPAGYRGIAHLLQPERVWAAWRYHQPGNASGILFDGLVWCDERWVWFPKPFRELRSLVTEPLGKPVIN
jgi:hypothetical protein